jgi:hypothetical protein
VNLTYLGDALDHWKGSLFEFLQATCVLRNLAVDPMATDPHKWTSDDFALYARLLRVRNEKVIRHNFPLAVRTGYFAETRHGGDLFLDPDTGIDTGGLSPIANYVKPDDIAWLLSQADARTLAVYQHVRAQKTSARVDCCLNSIARVAPDVACCSYESGTVAMLFISLELDRIRAVSEALHGFLGRHAERRVRIRTTRPGTASGMHAVNDNISDGSQT